MVLSITHPFVTAKSDGGDATKARPSNWNAAHTVAGLGTGVETALGVNVGSAGAFVVNGGALGTPSSGDVSNCTGAGGAAGGSDTQFQWNNASAFDGANLYRESANTIAQRNATTAQAFQVHNTWSSSGTNYERIALGWSSNVAYVVQEYGGSGSFRSIFLGVGPVGSLFCGLHVHSSGSDIYLGGGTWGSRFTNTGFYQMKNDGLIGFQDTAFAGGSFDTGLRRVAAGVLGVCASASTGAALNFIEQTAPSAPAANQLVLYAEDNGSGKTKLMARFNTGTAVQVAIEP
jgi:hypothetical protein